METQTIIIEGDVKDVSFIQSGTAAGLEYQKFYPFPFDVRFLEDKTSFNPDANIYKNKPLSEEEILNLEKRIFESKKSELLKRFKGKYIAMLNGEVLDNDTDISELASRIYEKYGYRTIFMPLVTAKKEKVHRMSPKFRAVKIA
ncbi:MAG: DUF5678 domain-containing protein [Bacteroidia bacterium]